jgi:hypothetical protein
MRRIYDTEGDWGRLLEAFARAAAAWTGNYTPDTTLAL